MGGYVASVALRAAAAESPFSRPASFFCQYLGVAAFDVVDLEVTTLRQAKTALAQRVKMRQGDREILEATIWSVGDVDGLTHDVTTGPDVTAVDETPSAQERFAAAGIEPQPGFPFWNNLESRPVDWWDEWETRDRTPQWREWVRFVPTATFDDPWVDACRSLIIIDVQSWPSASRAHDSRDFIAPSLDLYVAFHSPQPKSEWILADGYAPIARDGLMAWNGRAWSEDGALIASGSGQMLCRRVPTPN
jgi:acyl-CoA thioesterase-2